MAQSTDQGTAQLSAEHDMGDGDASFVQCAEFFPIAGCRDLPLSRGAESTTVVIRVGA